MALANWHVCKRWTDAGFRCPFGRAKDGERDIRDEVEATPFSDGVQEVAERVGVNVAAARVGLPAEAVAAAEGVTREHARNQGDVVSLAMEAEVGAAFGADDLGALLAFFLIVRAAFTLASSMSRAEITTIRALRNTVPLVMHGQALPRGRGGGMITPAFDPRRVVTR